MIVLIPSYQPDERLVAIVRDLLAVDGLHVVVVDDGSGPAFGSLFAEAAAAGAEVLHHRANRGKGAALRTGFAHIERVWPGQPVVCADSDGQHTLLDILRVAAALDPETDVVLGVRRFTGRVPLRSRFGNSVTAGVFALVTGTRISDTQTGLRAYPHRLLGWLGEVPGDRFEYELNLLLRAARERRRIRQVEIATVYLNDNASSHFKPLQDSLRVFWPMLAFARSSLAGFAVDASVLFALYPVTGNLTASVVAARLVSASVSFWLNRQVVFGAAKAPLWPSVRRYALLAGAILAANLALMQALTPLVGLVAAKLLTEIGLFLVGYAIQNRVVFRPDQEARVRPATEAPAERPVAAAR